MNKVLEAVPAEVREDWEQIVARPGMNVLSTWLYYLRMTSRRDLENPALDTIASVENQRGHIAAYNNVINFIKSESKRAVSGEPTSDTSFKKED